MQDPLRIRDLPEVVQQHLKGVAKDTRLWSHERSSIALGVDFIDQKVEEASDGPVFSLWDQIVILLYNILYNTDELTQRESWLALGEVRQAIRQAMTMHPMVGAGAEGEIFRAQFSEHLDHILLQLSPDPENLI